MLRALLVCGIITLGDRIDHMQLKSVYRLMVFVPPDAVESLRASLRATGALEYGDYADVMWRSTPGEECFTPRAGSMPTVGSTGEATHCASTQLVFSIAPDKSTLETVMHAISSVHPWEEPVVFVDETMVLDSRG